MSESILEEAQRLVGGARQGSYGHPLDNWTRTAALWSVILGREVTAEQAALCMVAVKIARHVHTGQRDNLVDAAGYALVVQMIGEERERRARIAEPSVRPDVAQMPAVRPDMAQLPEHDE